MLATIQSAHGTPKTITWFRIYCIATVLLIGALLFLILMHRPKSGVSLLEEGHAGVPLLAVVIIVVTAAVFFFALVVPRRPWVWTLDLILIAGGVGSIFFPITIVLLLYWFKPATRQYFGLTTAVDNHDDSIAKCPGDRRFMKSFSPDNSPNQEVVIQLINEAKDLNQRYITNQPLEHRFQVVNKALDQFKAWVSDHWPLTETEKERIAIGRYAARELEDDPEDLSMKLHDLDSVLKGET